MNIGEAMEIVKQANRESWSGYGLPVHRVVTDALEDEIRLRGFPGGVSPGDFDIYRLEKWATAYEFSYRVVLGDRSFVFWVDSRYPVYNVGIVYNEGLSRGLDELLGSVAWWNRRVA